MIGGRHSTWRKILPCGRPNPLARAQLTYRDGFALNLGPEDWQLKQAHSGFSVLASRASRASSSARPFRMFLSMDMNVLPSSSRDDAQALLEKVSGIMRRDGYLRYLGQLVLSTFGGHDKVLGGCGWDGFLNRLQSALGEKVGRSIAGLRRILTGRSCSSRRSSCPRSSSSTCRTSMGASRGITHGERCIDIRISASSSRQAVG